jgi:hypothetical protein
MRPSALLRGAAIYLGAHGWTQHQFFDLLAATDGPFPPACTSGAIMTAAHGYCPASGIAANGMATIDAGDDPASDAAIRALRVFAAWLDLEYSPNGCYDTSAIDIIGDWNDYDGRSLDEVIETLMDAANDWETTHHTGGAR